MGPFDWFLIVISVPLATVPYRALRRRLPNAKLAAGQRGNAVHYLTVGAVAVTVIGVAAIFTAGLFAAFGNWAWLAMPIIAWFLWSLWTWTRKRTGDENELEWLDELCREHEAGTHDHSERLFSLIRTIEKEHAPSAFLAGRLERARRVLHKGPRDEFVRR
jgi:hypothetical protein